MTPSVAGNHIIASYKGIMTFYFLAGNEVQILVFVSQTQRAIKYFGP